MNEESIAEAKKIINILKLSDISILIGRTNNGELSFKIPKEGEPHFTLDSVPVTKDTAKELSKILLN